MSEDWFTIINGAAGGGRCRARADGALARLRRAGMSLDVCFTEAPGHATELARDAFADGHRHFLSVGGDGTSYEIVNGLFPEADGHEVTLGMLPLGTGNSFLRDFEITDAESALAALERGTTRSIDVVRADHLSGAIHYINLLSIGFTADAGSLMNRRFKALGAAGYIAAVLICVARLQHPVDAIQLDDREVVRRAAAFLSFSNSRFTGGTMMMAPEADAGDGELDVIRVGAMPRGTLAMTFPKIFTGQHVQHPDVEAGRAKRVAFPDPREQDVMVDGEILRLSLESLTVLPSALSVVA